MCVHCTMHKKITFCLLYLQDQVQKALRPVENLPPHSLEARLRPAEPLMSPHPLPQTAVGEARLTARLMSPPPVTAAESEKELCGTESGRGAGGAPLPIPRETIPDPADSAGMNTYVVR